MKLEACKQNKPFEKFSITIETEEEAQELMLRFLNNSDEISQHYREWHIPRINQILQRPGAIKMYEDIREEMSRQGLTEFLNYFRRRD